MVGKAPTSVLQVPTHAEWKTLKYNMKAPASKFRHGNHTCYLRPGLTQVNKSPQKTSALYFANSGLFVVPGGRGSVSPALMKLTGAVRGAQGSPTESKAVQACSTCKSSGHGKHAWQSSLQVLSSETERPMLYKGKPLGERMHSGMRQNHPAGSIGSHSTK